MKSNPPRRRYSGARLYKLILVPQPGIYGQGWSPQKRVNRDKWDNRHKCVNHVKFNSFVHKSTISATFSALFSFHMPNTYLAPISHVQLVLRPDIKRKLAWLDWVQDLGLQNYINTLFAWPAFMFINWIWGDKTIILGGPKVFGPHKWISRWQKNNSVLPNLNWGDQKCLGLANFHFLVNLGL